MPKIRRRNLPPPLFRHLLDRIEEREIPAEYSRSFGMAFLLDITIRT